MIITKILKKSAAAFSTRELRANKALDNITNEEWCEMEVKRIEKLPGRHPETVPSGYKNIFIKDDGVAPYKFKSDGDAIAEFKSRGGR